MCLNYAFIHRTIPFVSACIDRHLHGCSPSEKETVMTMKKTMMARVNHTCPEVTCDVCKAQNCLQMLEDMSVDTVDYCRYDNMFKIPDCHCKP